MTWVLLGGVVILALGVATFAIYRLGRAHERDEQSRRTVETLEAKDARRQDSLAAAQRYVDFMFPEDSGRAGGPDAP